MRAKKALDVSFVVGIFVVCVNGKIKTTLSYSQHYVTADGRPPAICGDIERISKQSEGSSFDDLKASLKRKLGSCPREGVTVEMFKDIDIHPDKIRASAPRWMPSGVHEWVKDCASPEVLGLPDPAFKVIVIKMSED
ncbi:hypothetical protein [Ktedonospora formicarum]|uniref:Uncharacterized protein n=1 Tax=Ktedonospora formicarum TaxID=2778364 RepID=A0A8J3I9E3_9CHLR|nr:hypothetical protein [Ktedonospora formicarum]GHO49245.1 hypothetical protein KSX_74080 [Ktedonospora formicarum]